MRMGRTSFSKNASCSEESTASASGVPEASWANEYGAVDASKIMNEHEIRGAEKARTRTDRFNQLTQMSSG